MLDDHSALLRDNPAQLNYGMAVTDVDNDGAFEVYVAGFGFPNLVLKWTGVEFVNVATTTLANAMQRTIGVAACDIDADGHEEIYVLNTDTFSGRKRAADRLFDMRGGVWADLCALPENQPAQNLIAGRSVISIDRDGDGRYGFFVLCYGGPMRLYELDGRGRLRDMATEAQLNLVSGGRGAVALPLVSDHMDIFAANEQGANFLFRNRGDGTFEEVAQELGIADADEHGRGITVLDANGDGRFDIVYGNWEGPHRFFVQSERKTFTNIAPPALAAPSRVRTVLAADFDNDGYEELFFNNIGEPNRLFRQQNGLWVPCDIGAAEEPEGLGTGAVVGDFDGDGRLELLVSHGETAVQPLSLYRASENGHNWLRVQPLTVHGAPARGAVVVLKAGGRWQRRAIDAGSGYLCQMEPVAHFGLGSLEQVERVVVRWPDGSVALVHQPRPNTLIKVAYPVC